MTMTFGAPTFWGGKEGGRSKKAEEWSNVFNATLSVLDKNLTLLYNGIKTDEDVPVFSSDKADRDTTELSLHDVCAQFVSHCEKLIEMLSEPTNGTVKLSLGKLLAVVKRCLLVTHNDVYSVPSMIQLAELLPTIHKSILNLISQLILCCRTILMPQSRTLIDLCLNGLSSMTNMNQLSKSQTRGSIYNVLNLLIETMGWSDYSTSQLKILTQELISDIKLRKDAVKKPTATDKQDAVVRKKKRGKRKANKAESYSELQTVVDDAPLDNRGDNLAFVTSSTVAALQLSRHALENVEFIFVESLMSCILDTAKTLQREGPPLVSSYVESVVREELYKSVFICSLVYLSSGCSRKKVITHFQMSNTAINLLRDGLYLDTSFEVQKSCKHVLTIWKLTSHLNRPIVRRILPDDCTDKEDIMEIEKEKQQLFEENEQLRQRLVSTEMENKHQSRLIAALQQELKDMKRKSTEVKSIPRDLIQENDESSENEGNDPAEDETVRLPNVSKQPGGLDVMLETMDVNREDEVETLVAQSKMTAPLEEEAISAQNRTPVKRKLGNEIKETSDLKKNKILERITAQEQSDNESLQAMISDFVDAEPDIL